MKENEVGGECRTFGRYEQFISLQNFSAEYVHVGIHVYENENASVCVRQVEETEQKRQSDIQTD
jgi:glutathionylspermidine synthase